MENEDKNNKERIEELEGDKNISEIESNRLNINNNEMVKKIKSLEIKSESDEAKIKDQKNQIDTLSKEIADHSNSLIKFKMVNKKLNKEIIELNTEVKNLQSDKENLNKNKTENENIINEKNEQIKKIGKEKEDLNIIIKKNTKEINNYKSNIEKIKTDLNEQIKTNKDLKDKIEKKNEDFEKQKKELKEKITSLKKKGLGSIRFTSKNVFISFKISCKMAFSGKLNSFNLNEFLVILVTLFISALASKFFTTKTISISSQNLVHNTSPSFSGLPYLSHKS